LHAFDQVHQIILKRNILIKHELVRIGPDVADRIERLKLAIKHEQDEVGPAAEKALTRSFLMSVIASALVITFGIAAAAFSGAGITRPLLKLSETAAAMRKATFRSRSISTVKTRSAYWRNPWQPCAIQS
jgi:methyl-accepting chemotaxis protein